MLSFLIEENEGIRKFLEGDDSYIPISEYRYLHDRPLLRPSFLTQIHDLVEHVGAKIVKAKLTGKPVDDLTRWAVQLGTQMGEDLTEDRIKIILFTLRELYVFCHDMDKRLK